MIHLIFIPSLTNHHFFSQFGSTISFQCSLTLHNKSMSLSHTLEKKQCKICSHLWISKKFKIKCKLSKLAKKGFTLTGRKTRVWKLISIYFISSSVLQKMTKIIKNEKLRECITNNFLEIYEKVSKLGEVFFEVE